MRESAKPRSRDELRAVMFKAGADVLGKRISRRQHTAILAQVEAELAAQGLQIFDLVDLRDESPGGRGEAMERGPAEGTGTSG
jgi:predicted regulator of amino acid metabolism with ACT domain